MGKEHKLFCVPLPKDGGAKRGSSEPPRPLRAQKKAKLKVGELDNDIDTVADEFGWQLTSAQLTCIRTSPWLKSITRDPKLRDVILRVDAAADREKALALAR